MKRIKKILVKATKEHMKEVETFVCDFCGHEATEAGSGLAYSMRICSLCERHCCNKCAHLDPRDPSDYPDTYCPVCYKLRFTTYRKEIEDIEEEAYNKKDTIIQKIIQESLQAKL